MSTAFEESADEEEYALHFAESDALLNIAAVEPSPLYAVYVLRAIEEMVGMVFTPYSICGKRG